MNQDGPNLDCAEEDHVQVALHGADENEDAFGGLAKRIARTFEGLGRLTGKVEIARSHPADGTLMQPMAWEL